MPKIPKKGTFDKKLLSLSIVKENIRLSYWIDELLSKGKTSFTTSQLKDYYVRLSDVAIKRSLDRLVEKQKIVSLSKGYYIIVPPQYYSRGILPPPLFIDGLMQYLERPYYVGLLNAAAFYGAAHQQPQEYFVFTDFPVIKPTKKKNLKINYISRKKINENILEKRNTESGYLKISSPELTAIDLIQFEKRIGGLNRATTVLDELVESVRPEMINEELLSEVSVTAIQRLGFLLEKELSKKEIADHLFEQSKKAGLSFFRIPLKLSETTKGFHSDERWKVIVNTEIEIDE